MRETSDVDVCPRCQKCDRWRAAPEFIRDPMILWDRFPCPPPETDQTRLLLELDWTGRLGASDGCEALKRVAKRCHVNFKKIDAIPRSLVECEELFDAISFCGTQCIIAVILACICIFFLLLLIAVCRRYVRGTNKESSTICTKVLTSDHAVVNSQNSKYYVENQYFHRPNNIPDRRRLPCEARLVENGVEARLLRAIQETPVHHYNVEDLCPQCLAESRQNAFQYSGNRPGYEPITWKDKDYFQKRVPSIDSLNRRSISYKRSANGSSSDVSHLYEYISDYPYAPSYSSTGRTSTHSPKLYSRNNSLSRIDNQPVRDYRTLADTSDTSNRQVENDKDGYNIDQHPRKSVTSIHSKYEERSPYPRYWTERSPYQPSGSDKSTYQRRFCDKTAYTGYGGDNLTNVNKEYNLSSEPSVITCNNKTSNEIQSKANKNLIPEKVDSDGSKLIKGYKYTINPSYYEETKKAGGTTSTTIPKSNSEHLHIDNCPPDSTANKQKQKRKGRKRRQSSDSYNSNCSESTSLSGSYNTNVFKRDRNYNGTTISDN